MDTSQRRHATRSGALAVRSFKDEYLLDLVNLDNVDARYGYETDERVLSKSMAAKKNIAGKGQ